MYDYLYDGSFDGMLTAIYEAYYRPEKPARILREGSQQQSLFADLITIERDEEKAQKVYHAIKEKISPTALKHVFYAFLSEDEEAATKIYRYLQLGWRIGKRVDDLHTEDRVFDLHRLSQKVSKEAHLMLGILRFQKIEGDFYYAEIEPNHNITMLLAPHFSKRMADQNWMIYDIKRNVAALYNKETWILREGHLQGEMPLDQEEVQYQDLWKKYFTTIAIKERKNPRLQRSFIPKRYWKHLIELKDR